MSAEFHLVTATGDKGAIVETSYEDSYSGDDGRVVRYSVWVKSPREDEEDE